MTASSGSDEDGNVVQPAVRPTRRRSEAWFGGGVIVLLAVALAASQWARPRGVQRSLPAVGNRVLHNFELTERSGRTVRDTDLRGRFLVVGFVQTGCTLTCRFVGRHMVELQERVAGSDDVRLVSITVDPREDTPAALSEWARKLGADPDHWLFLTGETRTVHALIERSFLTRDPQLRGAMPGEFADTDHVAIVDRSGRIRAYVDGMRGDMATRVLEVLERLRGETYQGR